MADRIPTKVLSVRLTIEALEAIEKAAVDAKTTKSAYAARVLLEAASGKAPPPPKPSKPESAPAPPTIAKGIVLSDPKALDELRRIGVNINQIAHALNAGHPTRDGALASAASQLFALLKDPDAFMRCVAELPAIPPSTAHTAVSQSVKAPADPLPVQGPGASPPPLPAMTTQASLTFSPPNVPTGYSVMTRTPEAKPQPIAVPTTSPSAASAPHRKPNKKLPRRPAERHQSLPSTKVPLAPAKPMTQEARRDPPHPQAWHQLQDRAPVRPARPGPAEDRAAGRLGFFRKLWGR